MRKPRPSARKITLWASCAVGLLLGLAPRPLQGQTVAGCQAPPAVQAALDRLPSDPALRIAPLRVMLRQYPNDLYVLRAYINSGLSSDEMGKLAGEYKARHERHPENAQLDYLYGLTLVGRRTPEAIKLFDAALKKAPGFAWPHLGLAEIYVWPVFLDKQKATANIKAFLTACPSVLEGYSLVGQLSNPDLTREAVGKLREALAKRTDRNAIGAYPTLWMLEFQAHPPSGDGQVRQQVARDLARIRALKLEDQGEWYLTLQAGYKLINDQKQADWAKDQLWRRYPFLYLLPLPTLPEVAKWFQDHRPPDSDASSNAIRAYYSALLAATGRWAATRPKGPLRNIPPDNLYVEIQRQRLEAMEHLDDVPAADVEEAVDRMFKFTGERGPYSGEGVYSLAAQVLSKKHLDPQRLVELAQKRLAMVELQSRTPPSDLYATGEGVGETRTRFLKFEAEGYLELKQTAKAQRTLQQLDEGLQDLKPLIGDKQGRREAYLGQESAYWVLMARLAELQGRELDAMAYYESALLDRIEAKQRPAPGKEDELADNAHKLWTKLGGTEDGWNAWYGEREAALASVSTLSWKNVSQPLPAFKLSDLHGKTWTLADLKGKETFLTFWATG